MFWNLTDLFILIFFNSIGFWTCYFILVTLELWLHFFWTKEIKEILLKNGYPHTLIERIFNQEPNSLKNNIIYGPEKCPLALILPCIDSQSTSFERTIRRITEKACYSVKPSVILKCNPILTLRGKDLITDKNSSSLHFSMLLRKNKVRDN